MRRRNLILVVLDDVVPAIWPKPNLLAIHVANSNWFDTGWTTVQQPTAVDWKNTHPLLRYINLDNVQISETIGVKTPSWAAALVEAQQTPLILAGETARQKIVWIGFDTLQKHLAAAHFLSDVHRQRGGLAESGGGQIEPAHGAWGRAVSVRLDAAGGDRGVTLRTERSGR